MQATGEGNGDSFSAFQMPRKEMHDLDITRYRVYRTSTEYVMVVADNAAEAMQKAGIAEPLKVQREFPLYRTLLTPDWIGVGVAVAAKVEESSLSSTHKETASAKKAAQQESALAVVSLPDVGNQPDAPLSQEEINKLLES